MIHVESARQSKAVPLALRPVNGAFQAGFSPLSLPQLCIIACAGAAG
jgi:hypothetical protein